MPKYIVNNIKLPYRTSRDAALKAAEKHLLKFFSKENIISLNISKRSVDARKKDNICFVYSVSAEISDKRILDSKKLLSENIVGINEEKIEPIFGNTKMTERPVIVGFGPCGMFCSLLLAEYGFKPIIIERGSDIPQRTVDVERFLKNQALDTESNIQFGAGGAGTFSDGKLITRINDKKCSFVLKTMAELGAPEEILYEAKPHIGTDNLKKVVSNMKNRLESLGAEIHFNTKFIGFSESGNGISSVITDKGEIKCSLAVLALGHSARDTFSFLLKKNFEIIPKIFSVGVRAEHLQTDIDKGLYGVHAGDPILPKGEYSLSYREGERGVYSFCMCPGGNVIAAASEDGGVVTNGMSYYKRDEKNANSAIAVNVLPDDYGNTAENAIAFQRALERKAFIAGGTDYSAPSQTLGDFLNGFKATAPTKVLPTYMDGKVKMCDLNTVLPPFVSDMLKKGFSVFGKKLPGFDAHDTVLTGVETRTSSPLRIMRKDDFTAIGYDNIYPCGEGAGYAGGITSAAVDGVNCALSIMSKYSRE